MFTREVPPHPQAKYKIRMGNLEIRTTNRWKPLKNFEFHELTSANLEWPQPLQLIVEYLESVLKLGLPLLRYMNRHWKGQAGAEIDCLWRRIYTLLDLWIVVGAALCRPEINLPQRIAGALSKNCCWTEAMLRHLVEGIEEISPMELDSAAPTEEEKAALEKFADEINREYRSNMEIVTYILASLTLGFKLKEIGG